MNIGSYGGMIFQVSNKKIYTFNNLKRTRNAEWKEHTRYGQKPLSQFIAPGLETISIDIHLDATLGIKPKTIMDKWGTLLETGYHDIFVIGGEQIGKYEWKIESISEAWNVILNKGELVSADLSITMSEYLSSDKNVTKKNSSTNTTKNTVIETKNVLVKGGSYKVKKLLTGYYTAAEASNQKPINKAGKVYPGNYYIFNISNGMINVTKVKGTPGSWINPSKNK